MKTLSQEFDLRTHDAMNLKKLADQFGIKPGTAMKSYAIPLAMVDVARLYYANVIHYSERVESYYFTESAYRWLLSEGYRWADYGNIMDVFRFSALVAYGGCKQHYALINEAQARNIDVDMTIFDSTLDCQNVILDVRTGRNIFIGTFEDGDFHPFYICHRDCDAITFCQTVQRDNLYVMIQEMTLEKGVYPILDTVYENWADKFEVWVSYKK